MLHIQENSVKFPHKSYAVFGIQKEEAILRPGGLCGKVDI